MTDDGIIAVLRQALATAQADAVEATARADRYARALTALCDAAREPDKSGGLQAVRESGPLNGATARTPTRMNQRVECDVCGKQVARRQLTNHKRKHSRPASPVSKSETEPSPRPAPRPVTPSEWLGRVDADDASSAVTNPASSPDDDEYEPLTWGANGENPPKVEHWSRHEEET